MSRNNVRQLLIEARKYLSEREIESPNLDTDLFMMKALGISKMELFMKMDFVPSDDEAESFWEMVKRRGEQEPCQYILGNCEFMSLDFYVDKNVLIPRPDTEILVETVLEKAKKGGFKRVMDIGTGSGAIAVSLVKYGIESATAVDISLGALAVATKNAESNGVLHQIEFINADVLDENFEIRGVDAVVSNPPYIEKDVIPTLMRNVRDYEPMNALDGGEDGLIFYRAITKKVKSGYLFYEIGYNQGEAVSKILEDNGFADIEVIKDLSGLDRVVCGRKMEEENA